MLGKTISHYKIFEKLGEGGMGVVYKAEDTKLKRTVALKFLRQESTRDSEAIDRFVQEAQAAAALNYPNICTVYEIDEVDGKYFIAMEYIDGQSLKEKIESGPLDVNNAVDIAIQVAEGLYKAHEKGMIHRDIKSANIMMNDEWNAKIMDFGLAKLAGQVGITKTGTTLGTVAYMSPEQTRGKEVDHRTDIWSLGVVLYEMLAGHLPFRGEYEQAVVYSILNVEPELITGLQHGVAKTLKQFVDKALVKNPDERYQLMEDVLVDLRAIRSGKHVAIKTVPMIQPVERHIVGRMNERAQLQRGLEAVTAGRGLLMCVTGEAGMGKTTFVENFFNELISSGSSYFIARGRSSERLAGTEGYLPILEALESLLHCSADDTLTEMMKQIAPTWYVEVVPLNSDDPSDARIIRDAKAASQERLKRELGAFLNEVSRLRPLILFVDDLHWADISTVDVLAFIGSKCESMPLLIVVSYRPEELLLSENQFTQVKQTMQTRRVCQEISLEFLNLDDIVNYLALEFPEHRFPKEFAQLIHKQTEGNPLFMVDLVLNLHDRMVIDKAKDRWVLKQSVVEIKSELPESIRSMIQRKIDQLTEPDRQLLIVASVQGNEFDSAVLATVLTLDPVEVEDRLEALANVHFFIRLIREYELPDMTPALHYSFVHILYQNAFYDSLSLTRKKNLCLSVAEKLLGFYGEKKSEIASELAFLFESGRDYTRASDFFILAAQNAMRLFANHEAETLFRRAISNAEKLPNKERSVRILKASLQLGQLHLTIGELEDSIVDFALAEKVAGETKGAEGQIYAICGQAQVNHLLRKMPETRALGNKALKLARAVKSTMGEASAQCVLAMERMCLGDLVAAEKYFSPAMQVLKKYDITPVTLEFAATYCFLPTWRLDYEQACNMSGWTIEETRKIGLHKQMTVSQYAMGMALGNQGLISEAFDIFYEATHLAEISDTHFMLARLPNALAWLYSELEDYKTAQKLNAKSVQVAQKLNDAEPGANAHVNLAHDYIITGEYDTAFEHLRAAEHLYESDIWFRWRYNIRLQAEFASYWIARGDLKLAAKHASTSLKAAEKTLSRKYIAWANKLLGDIAVLEDRVEEGKKHFETAMHILKDFPCPIIEWKILKASAELAKLRKDDVARDKFRGQARAIVQSLADSVKVEKLRKMFLSSKAVQEL